MSYEAKNFPELYHYAREHAPDDDDWVSEQHPFLPSIPLGDSDGLSLGLWDQEHTINDLRWLAPPMEHHTESLFISERGMILRLFHSKHPRFTGRPDHGGFIDHNSYAVQCPVSEAMEWLRRHNYEVPWLWLRQHGYPVPDEAGQIEAVSTKCDGPWSIPKYPAEWAREFHVSAYAVQRWIRDKTYPTKKNSPKARKVRFLVEGASQLKANRLKNTD